MEDLQKAGIGNINAKYTGWFNTGVKQTSAAKVKTVGRLGSSSDLEDLTAYADKTNGMQLYLNGTFNYVYKDKWFDGFSSTRNAASLSAVKSVSFNTGNPITYQAK